MTSGNWDSFRTFYDAVLPAVYSYLHQRLGADEQRAKDVTQMTFEAILAQWPLRADIDNQVGWAIAVARHKLIDELRRERRNQHRLDRYKAMEPTRRSSGTTDAEIRIHGALQALPGAQRIALLLAYVDDMPVADVARIMGRSEHAVESLLARGRRTLRDRYERAADV